MYKVSFLKKKIFIVLALIVIATLFVSCEIPSNPSSVALVSDGELLNQVKLDKFNDALVPKVDDKNFKEGYKFLGWSFVENDTEAVVSNGGVITYQLIYPHLTSNTVKMYPVLIEVTEEDIPDLVIGWYAKTKTSGLNEDIVFKLEEPLKNYFASKDYDGESLYIEFRPYDGDVATMGSNVNSDGDVDILIGVGDNITSKGNVETLEVASDILMGGKSRTNVRLNDSDIAKDAFIFLNSDDATNLLN